VSSAPASSNSFDHARHSLNHAQRRIDELHAEWQAFVEANPYRVVIERDAESGDDVHKVVGGSVKPVWLSGVASDALYGIRSALDQVGYGVACAVGKSGKQAHFPFADTRGEAEALAQRGSRQIPKEIFDLMISFQPYKGGDDLLWAMNKLRNRPHESILTFEPLVVGMAGSYSNPGMTTGLTWPPRWDRSKDEMILVRTAHGNEPNYDLNIEMLVAFADVDCVRRKPADTVLRAMASKVIGIVGAIEAEARRIGIIH